MFFYNGSRLNNGVVPIEHKESGKNSLTAKAQRRKG
ncbi:MAG: hypothetical protein K0Q79_503 [Flavipsychrobacter sp.]|jgi:hypothetical protein|nr:hypothetical protein [Flavipsychrobacter sp.]